MEHSYESSQSLGQNHLVNQGPKACNPVVAIVGKFWLLRFFQEKRSQLLYVVDQKKFATE